MPAPLWEDAKNYLLMQGAPISTFNLNNAMNELAANPSLRPSYGGGPSSDMAANMGLGPIQASGDVGVIAPQMQPSMQVTELDDRSALNALAPRKSSAPGPVARNVPARDARAVRAEAGMVPIPRRAPLDRAGQDRADIASGEVRGGAPGPGEAQAASASAPQMPGSGSDSLVGSIMDWFSQNGGKVAAGLGLAGGVAGAARMLGRGTNAGMRPRGAPGMGIGQGLPGTPPGGGSGSGFYGAMGTPVPTNGMAPNPAASPITGTLPLGTVGGGGLSPSVTMPLPPPTVSLSTHGNVPMSAYGPVAHTGVVPSGPAMSVPPGVINQPPPDIAGMLAAPKTESGPSAGGRIRSPRPRTPPTPKSKPSVRTAKKKNSR